LTVAWNRSSGDAERKNHEETKRPRTERERKAVAGGCARWNGKDDGILSDGPCRQDGVFQQDQLVQFVKAVADVSDSVLKGYVNYDQLHKVLVDEQGLEW
jgi:hypothetical protein